MAKKTLRFEEVKFEIAPDAFVGPYTCHKKKTILRNREVMVGSIPVSAQVWMCAVCKKEYIDFDQAKKWEAIWTVEMLLKKKHVSMKRSLNYDGKMFFLRIPKEVTKDWKKGQTADITFLSNKKFLVEVE